MVAFTTFRNYPYSTPGDPADVPAALQALAESIDTDVCALIDGAQARPVARIRGTGVYNSPAASVAIGAPPFPAFYRLPFDTVDFDTIGISVQSQTVQNRLLMPTVPGFYFAIATVFVPTAPSTLSPVSFTDISIQRGNASVPAGGTSRQSGTSYNQLAGNFTTRVFSTGSGGFFNGTTDAFAVDFRADTSPDLASYPVGERSLTILRMTES